VKGVGEGGAWDLGGQLANDHVKESNEEEIDTDGRGRKIVQEKVNGCERKVLGACERKMMSEAKTNWPSSICQGGILESGPTKIAYRAFVYISGMGRIVQLSYLGNSLPFSSVNANVRASASSVIPMK